MQNVLIASPGRGEGATPAIHEALYAVGYRVAWSPAEDGDALCAAFHGVPPDVIINDLSSAADLLPARHLRTLLREIWGEDLPAPGLIGLTTAAHLSRREWLSYLDDFVLPPHPVPEILSRVELWLYRRRRIEQGQELRFADVRLNLAAGCALDPDDTPIPLTPKEYSLLLFLITHKGRLFQRDRLLAFVWGVHYNGGERTIDIHVRRLRAKLPPVAASLLETRRGLGYGFRPAPVPS
jgi:DNA-binding response OmpR family regulator